MNDAALTHQIYSSLKSDLTTAIHKNGEVSRHFHKNSEILICLEGNCICKINDQTYTISAGESIFICPIQIHSFSVPEGGSVRRITYHEHLILTISKHLYGRVPQNPVFRADPKILNFCEELLRDFFGTDSGYIKYINPFEKRMQVKGILHLLGGEFLRQAELIPTPKTDILALDIAQYIADNYENDISLKDIAIQKGYNYQYLSRTFNQYMEMNFKQMLNQYRAQQAFSLLLDSELPVSEIGLLCGFQSIRSFNSVFKETFDATPTKVRERTKNSDY